MLIVCLLLGFNPDRCFSTENRLGDYIVVVHFIENGNFNVPD